MPFNVGRSGGLRFGRDGYRVKDRQEGSTKLRNGLGREQECSECGLARRLRIHIRQRIWGTSQPNG